MKSKKNHQTYTTLKSSLKRELLLSQTLLATLGKDSDWLSWGHMAASEPMSV